MTLHQPDLFAPSGPPGLLTAHDAVSPAEEADLIAQIDAAGLTPFAFRGWTGKRLTASFGSAYDYSRGRVLPAPPIPPWLLAVRARLARLAGLEAERFEQALVIRYDPGAGIGWHRDRPQYGTVAGLSLGAAETLRMRLRRPDGGFDRHAIPLEPRGAYVLSGPARTAWEHAIAPVAERRWSVTFRTLQSAPA